MVGHGGSSAGSYLANPTSPIPSHGASVVTTSTVRVNLFTFIHFSVCPHCALWTACTQKSEYYEITAFIWPIVWKITSGAVFVPHIRTRICPYDFIVCQFLRTCKLNTSRNTYIHSMYIQRSGWPNGSGKSFQSFIYFQMNKWNINFGELLIALLTLTSLNFWKFTSYCSLNPLWSGMGEVVPARTSPTLHPPSPPTVHQLSQLAL